VSRLDHTADTRKAFSRASLAAQSAAKRTSEESSPLHMFSEQMTKEGEPETGDGRPVVRIGVVGHSYLLFDSGLSLDVLDMVRDAGARPVVVFPTADEVSHEAQRETALNWYYELELLAAARNLLEVHKVDGLLLVASFACGTGAVTNELIQREAVHRHRVPTILVLLDEHTGEGGLVTRVESFVDLLRLRKR
jgi:predicted nucleotide-binding protein (sugar kinase/HSP70/actin superfamily)